LSHQSVKLTTRCLEVRLARVRYELGSETVVWPPPPEKLDRSLHRMQLNAKFNRWHEYYNAACLYALPLMAGESDRDAGLNRATRDKFARRAVGWLENAATSADSAYIAGQRDWLLSEDPDLDGLRPHRFFKDFEAMYLPSKDATPERPRHAKTLESSRYVKELLETTARCWEDAWHRRAARAGTHPDVHELLEWWKDEREAWARVREVALNNRDWPTRVKLLKDLEEYAHTYRQARPEVAFPRYSDDPLGPRRRGSPAMNAKNIAAEWATHFHAIGETIPDPETGGEESCEVAEIDKWERTLRGLDARGRGPLQFMLAELCDHHAALWQRLREWVVAEEPKRNGRRKRFEQQLEATKQRCREAENWWHNRDWVAAAAKRGARSVLVIRTVNGTRHRATPVG
jgi:hypothetical protein